MEHNADAQLEDPSVWYFAYGANLDRATLVDRRRIVPSACVVCRLDGFELLFNQPGLPILEPSFANIAPAPSSSVHGVAYRLTPEQLATLDVLEGGGAYAHLEVELITQVGERLMAKTYAARETRQGLLPSRRYMKLIIAGGRAQGLPDAWIESLEAQRTAMFSWASPMARVVMWCAELFFRVRGRRGVEERASREG